MAHLPAVEFVCPRCRPEHDSVLDADLRCPGCGHEFPGLSVDDGPRVAVLLDPDDASAGLEATERLLEGLDRGDFVERSGSESAYLSALAIHGGAHFGRWARPPLPTPDLGWITEALEQISTIPEGPVLILGSATGGEALSLPADREIVALDGSLGLLGFISGLAASDQWLPVQTTPGRYTRRLVELPDPIRARLRQLHLLAADAREPPLPPGTFALVLALNLLDSITHPQVLLHQVQALLRPGGMVMLSTPYNWDDDVTPPERRLDAEVIPGEDHAAAVESRIQTLLPRMRLRWSDRDVPWPLRVHDRLRCEFRLHAMLLQRER